MAGISGVVGGGVLGTVGGGLGCVIIMGIIYVLLLLGAWF